PGNVRLAEAPSFGKPIVLYDVQSVGAKSYLAVAQELIRRVEQGADAAASSGSSSPPPPPSAPEPLPEVPASRKRLQVAGGSAAAPKPPWVRRGRRASRKEPSGTG